MLPLTSLSDDELNKLVAGDNAAAMCEKAQRYLTRGNIKKARQFFTLSSILGDRRAHIELARIYEEDENFEDAYTLYTRALSKGEDSVLPRIALLIIRSNPRLGMELLHQNASSGHLGCIKELINIYKADPVSADYQSEITFWTQRLEKIEALTAAKTIENSRPKPKTPPSPKPPPTSAPAPKKRKSQGNSSKAKRAPSKKTSK